MSVGARGQHRDPPAEPLTKPGDEQTSPGRPSPSSGSRRSHGDPPLEGGRRVGARAVPPPAVPPQGAGLGAEPLFQLPQPDRAARVPPRAWDGPGERPARPGAGAAPGPPHPGSAPAVTPGGRAARSSRDRARPRTGGCWGSPAAARLPRGSPRGPMPLCVPSRRGRREGHPRHRQPRPGHGPAPRSGAAGA